MLYISNPTRKFHAKRVPNFSTVNIAKTGLLICIVTEIDV